MKIKEKGYFTVEASFIFPLATLFMTVMIFMSFYCYDRCILEQSAYQAAMRGSSNMIHSINEAKLVATKEAQFLIKGKLFAVDNLSYDVQADLLTVKVSYECKVNMPFITWLSKLIKDVDFTIRVEQEAYRKRYVDGVRIREGIKGLLE